MVIISILVPTTVQKINTSKPIKAIAKTKSFSEATIDFMWSMNSFKQFQIFSLSPKKAFYCRVST